LLSHKDKDKDKHDNDFWDPLNVTLNLFDVLGKKPDDKDPPPFFGIDMAA
jgi:hypothetical protein